MRCLSLALVALLLGGCFATQVSDGEQWTERARRIQIGMRRAEVERILAPAEVDYIESTLGSGSRQESYVVASLYAVTVSYASVNGARESPHPDDRVVAPAVVEHRHPQNESEARPPDAVTLQPAPIFRK